MEKEGRWRSRERYPCEDTCFDQGHSIDAIRSELRCSLIGFNPRRWTPAKPTGSYMGRLPIYDDPKCFSPREPPETHHEGCPGGWYRSRFARSLLPYQRTGIDGVLNENLRLSRCEDPLVLDAIQYLEQEQARRRSWNADRVMS